MEFLKQKSKKIIISLIFLSLSGLYAFGSSSNAIEIHSERTDQGLKISFSVSKGFGIQKKGSHKITIYDGDISKGSDKNPKVLYEQKNILFSGKDAKQDKDYFSQVNPLDISFKSKGPITVKARVFYCSFIDNFCSVQMLQEVVK